MEKHILPINREFFTSGIALVILLPFCLMCGLLFCVNWKIAVVFLCFFFLLAFDYFFPNLVMIPVLFVIPFDRLARLGPDSPITFAKILLTVIIIAWIMRILTFKDRLPLVRLRGNYLFLLSILFLVFSLLSIINSQNDDLFSRQIIRRFNVVFLFLLITNYLYNKNLIRRALMVLVISYTCVGFLGLYEIYSQESILSTYWGEEDTALEFTLSSEGARVSGPGGDPDFHAVALILPTLIAGYFLYRSKSMLSRFLLILFIFLMLVNMLGTGSRGGLLSFLIGIGVLWLFSKVKYKYAIGLAGGIGILFTILIMQIIAPEMPIDRYSGGGTQSIVYRIGWMEMAYKMIAKHPFLGIGTGNVPSEYNRYIYDIPHVPREPHWTHNSFLQMWAETGFFGFIVYTLIFVVSAAMMWDVVKNTSIPSTRTFGILLLSILASYFFFAGTSNIIENENYWIVFALCSVIYSIHKEERISAKKFE